MKASGVLASAIITRARTKLSEASAIRWSDADLLQLLNDGQNDVCGKTLSYQGSESVTLVANTIEYTPTGAFYKIIGAVLNPASGTPWGLIKSNLSSRGSSQDDVPRYWYEFAGKIGIYPAYTAVTTQTATVYYGKQPTTLISSNALLTPAVFDLAITNYIVAMAFLLDGQTELGTAFYNLYLSDIAPYRQDLSQVDNETAEPVR